MKKFLWVYWFALVLHHITLAQAGKELFLMHCASCHGISDGAFGPRLGGIHTLKSRDELILFIKDATRFLKNPDVRTKALASIFKTPMPPFSHLTETEINKIIDYIIEESDKSKSEPLSINQLLTRNSEKRYAPPVQPSKLYIELEEVVQIPRTQDHLDDKGINTMRANELGVFISDQMGQIYKLIKENNGLTTAYLYFDFKSATPNFIFYPSIGAGLGSFCFHPDFIHNGLLYTAHNEKYLGYPAINEHDWPDSVGIEQQYIIEEWKTNDPESATFNWTDRRVVMRINTPTFAHSGQDLTFSPMVNTKDPDYGMLYYCFGDGGTANIKRPDLAHRTSSILGTILRIDPKGSNGSLSSYGIPADNPYAKSNDTAIQKEIYAYGFRNPYRLEWDITRKKMYIADIGESNVEEINEVLKGKDYGWAYQEGKFGIDVTKDKTTLFERPDKGVNNSILPIATYDHTAGHAISGGYIYKGALKPLKDKYIFGDIVNGKLFYTDAGNFKKGIFEINILQNGKETSIQDLCGKTRTHLRMGYDRLRNDLYIMTKPDNKLRKVSKAIWK